MPEEKHQPQVFISYSRRNLAFVEELAADLQAAGLKVWYDLSGLEGGSRWSKAIETAIRASQYVIVVLSPDLVASKWVEEEFLLAGELGKKIIPLLYKPCNLPFGYRTLHFVDIQGSKYPKNYEEILRALDLKRIDRETAEKVVHAKYAEIAGRKKAEEDAVEKAVREKAERDATEKAKKEAAEKIAREAARIATREKTTREQTERRAVRKAVLANQFSQLIEALKSLLSKVLPLLRIMGFLGVIFLLLWGGSRIMPEIIDAIPTPKTNLTITPSATEEFLIILESPAVTETLKPTATVTGTPTLIYTPSITPTPLLPEITDDFGVEMVLISAGDFIMGSEDGDIPLQTVYLDNYYIDKFEVTNGHYQECVDEGVCEKPTYSSSWSRQNYYGNPTYNDYPVIFVTEEMARAYCSWRNSSLPTEPQWEKAARGTDGRTYPWGEEDADCTKANYYDERDERHCVKDTSKVGSYPDGISPYGIYDIAGNVREYVEDKYVLIPTPTILSSTTSSIPTQTEISLPPTRIVYRPISYATRGGSWQSGSEEITTTTLFLESSVVSGLYEKDTGFRCARDATP